MTKEVDVTDLNNLSTCAETLSVNPVKFGEPFAHSFVRMATPSRAP